MGLDAEGVARLRQALEESQREVKMLKEALEAQKIELTATNEALAGQLAIITEENKTLRDQLEKVTTSRPSAPQPEAFVGTVVPRSLAWSSTRDSEQVRDCIFGTVVIQWEGVRYRVVTSVPGPGRILVFGDDRVIPQNLQYTVGTSGDGVRRGSFFVTEFDALNEPDARRGDNPSHWVVAIAEPWLEPTETPAYLTPADFVWDQPPPMGSVFKLCTLTRPESYLGDATVFNVLCIERRDWIGYLVTPRSLAWTDPENDVKNVSDMIFSWALITEGERSFRVVTCVPKVGKKHSAEMRGPPGAIHPGDLQLHNPETAPDEQRFCWRWFSYENVAGAPTGRAHEHRVITIERPRSFPAAGGARLNVAHFHWAQLPPPGMVFSVQRVVRSRLKDRSPYYCLTIEDPRKVVPVSLAFTDPNDAEYISEYIFGTISFDIDGAMVRVVVAAPGEVPEECYKRQSVVPKMLLGCPGFPPVTAAGSRFSWRWFAEKNVGCAQAGDAPEYNVITVEGDSWPGQHPVMYTVDSFAWDRPLPPGLRFNCRNLTRPESYHDDSDTYLVLTVE